MDAYHNANHPARVLSPRSPGRSPPTEYDYELQESALALMKKEFDLVKKERDSYKLQAEKERLKNERFKSMMQSDDEDSLISPRISQRNYRDYDHVKAECQRAMSELGVLKGENAHLAHELKDAKKECEYHRSKHQSALQSANQLQNEVFDLRSSLFAAMAEKEQLIQELKIVPRISDMERRELQELRQLYLTQRMHDPERRIERFALEDRDNLQDQLAQLNEKYLETISNLSNALKRTDAVEKDHARLKKLADEAVKEKSSAMVEKDELKRQMGTIQTKWESSLREHKKILEQLNKVQEKLDRSLVELQHEQSLRLKIGRELNRVTEERNMVQGEYKLVMSERDTVLRETQKVHDDLAAARQKIATIETDKNKAQTDLESLKREISSALQDRDQALKDTHELKERLANVEEIPQRASENERLKSDLEQMQQTIDGLRQEVAEYQKEISVIQSQRAFVYQKRDEAVLERESMRKLCDSIRKERDKAVRNLTDALRENENLKREQMVAVHECQQLREKLDRSALGSGRVHHLSGSFHNDSCDSAIDTELNGEFVWDTVEIELDDALSRTDIDVSEDCDSTLPSSLYVSYVGTNGSLAPQRLKVGDRIVRINSMDASHLDRESAIRALSSSRSAVNLVIKRRRQVKVVPRSFGVLVRVASNEDFGGLLSRGLFVSRIPSSSQLSESGLCVGDRINRIAGRVVGDSSPDDVEQLLRRYENQAITFDVVRYYASSIALDSSFDSSDSGKASANQHPFSYSEASLQKPKNHSIGTQTEADLERNDSTLRQKTGSVKGFRKSVFDVFPLEKSKLQSVTKTSSPSNEPKSTKLLDIKRLFGFDKKVSSRPSIKVMRHNVSEEVRVIQEFESVLEEHQSKHGTRSYTTTKATKSSGGTWPRIRTSIAMEESPQDDVVVPVRPPRSSNVDRKAIKSLTISARQLPWVCTDIPLDDAVVASPTPSTVTLKADRTERNKIHRLSGALYDTLPTTTAPSTMPVLRRKKSVNVDVSDSSSMSSSLDCSDSIFHDSKEAFGRSSVPPPIPYSSKPTVPDHYDTVVYRNTVRSRDKDILRNDPASPLFLSREETRFTYAGSVYGEATHLRRPIAVPSSQPSLWSNSEMSSSSSIVGRSRMPSGSADYRNTLDSSSSSIGFRNNSPLLVSPLDRNAPPLYQTVRRKPQIGQVRKIRLECGEEQLGFRIGSHNGGIYISAVLERSIAEREGLFVGDQILDVCGINLRSATYEAAVKVFKSAGSVIVLQVQYQGPLSLSQLGSTTSVQTPTTSSEDRPDSVGPTGTLKGAHHRGSNSLSPVNNNSQPRDARFVKLSKGLTDPPGINLIGGNVHGIFIHFVQPESAAARCGQLNCGDQILEYNGVNMRSLLLEKAVFELCKPVTTVSMVVQYNPEKFDIAKCNPGDQLYVRSLWDRDKSLLQDEELMFHKGDILFIDNTLYNGEIGSWRAWLLSENAQPLECGIIPNRYKAEEEYLALQQSNFDLVDSLDPNRKPSSRRSLFKRRKSKRVGTELASFSDSSLCMDTFSVAPVEPNIPTYLKVDKVIYEEMRPVLIVGPLSDLVVERLMQSYPDRFGRCPVHTTPEAPVAEDPDCVELRPVSGMWETVSVKSIREIVEKNQHCLLDINISSVERLRSFGVSPIVLLINFRSSSAIREVRDPVFNASKLSHKNAKDLFEMGAKISAEYGKSITSTVAGGTSLPCLVKLVANAIESAQTKPEWISLGPVV